MEGYDTSLIGNFSPIRASRKTGFSNATGVGSFFGVIANGFLIDIFGQSAFWSVRCLPCRAYLHHVLCINHHCPDHWRLLVRSALFASSAPAYASEVLPLSLRAYFTSYTHMLRVVISNPVGVAVGLAGSLDSSSLIRARIALALGPQWSPGRGREIIAKTPEQEGQHRPKADSRHNCPHKQARTGTFCPKLLELLQGIRTAPDRNRLRRVLVFAGQIIFGICFAYHSTYFFQQVGLTTAQTYKLNVGGTSLALVGTFCNWFFLMPYFGRRTIYVWGMFAMTLILFIIGILNAWTSNNRVGIAQAVPTLVWTFVFQPSAGQLGWALPAEIGSTRLRQKTVCLARNTYYLVGLVGGTLQPYFMNPTKWNVKGYTEFVWGGTALLTFIWAYFRLPKAKGRSFEEIDILFAKVVPARKFKSYEVDAYNEQENAKLAHGENVQLGHKSKENFVENLDRTATNA
ncbi:hypothetical protein POJ06DRAFT_264235 [Lipomyces tetrasporus]|uniref:Major facilitator superfamily (MFS) profile domain-containing protein n=1 Tax=Lipomyces tetrasporus TaxID=54092 RepID=A0AAD7VVU3_9ASCO|nr:uncharacterized protein POJ06DRAFT_264235 [Lipomyces tetrasporus]KAJ8103406.1 hypothetical protein POJ06DRAFT_264235 [Lipomyces tetrasporus]